MTLPFSIATVQTVRSALLIAARRDAAEAKVREWREKRKLYVPGFPTPVVNELRGSIPSLNPTYDRYRAENKRARRYAIRRSSGANLLVLAGDDDQRGSDPSRAPSPREPLLASLGVVDWATLQGQPRSARRIGTLRRRSTKMYLYARSLVVLVLLSATSVHAQVGRDVVERGSNRAQISTGKEALERDGKEVESFASQVASFEQAVAKGDGAQANQSLAALSPLMQTEVEQGGAKAEAAKREVAGSASETGSNRRESRRNRDDSNAMGRSDDDTADAVRDGVNRADDARDVADDKKDLEAIAQRTQRQQQITQQVAGTPIALDSDAGRQQASEQVAMMKEFEKLMRADLAATEAEIQEDRKEAGEDRRETRDDVREADEPDNRYRRETGNAGRRGR
jgi:hypothetical protein